LQLIELEELDISKISLAKVADQYLRHIENNKEIPPQELADFLVVATRLLVLKSRLLLPYLTTEEEDDDALGLERELKIYKEYLEASQTILEIINQKRVSFAPRRKFLKPVKFIAPTNVSMGTLRATADRILEEISLFKLPIERIRRVLNIKHKIAQIKKLIEKYSSLEFEKVIQRAESKVEIAVSFLAILELARQETLILKQTRAFQSIIIEKNAEY
jgi:segregation and condensation protein A